MPAGLKNIVVVGGGAAGTELAKTLSTSLDASKYALTLVTARDYFVHLPATLRMITSEQGKLEDRIIIPYDRLLKGQGAIVVASVLAITPNTGDKGVGGTLKLSNGTELSYYALILATGSHWEGGIDLPAKRSELPAFLDHWRKTIKNAKGIAVVGGGAVGTELAGEIRDIYPDQKITIIHRESHLLGPVYPNKFRLDVDDRWTKRHIRLILNDTLDQIPAYPAAQVVTAGGVRVDADLVLPTRGGRPNTEYAKSLGEGILNEAGQIKVNSNLQVVGHPGIFAMGDITDWKEVKQAVKYAKHSKTVAANLTSFLNDRPQTSVYKPMFELIALTNGAYGGAVYMDVLWGLCFGNWVAKTLKARDLFITPIRKALGY